MAKRGNAGEEMEGEMPIAHRFIGGKRQIQSVSVLFGTADTLLKMEIKCPVWDMLDFLELFFPP